MKKLIAYPLTVLYFLSFGLVLVIFHGILWFCHKVFGYNGLKKSVDCLQFFIMRCLNILGTRFTFNNQHKIPTDKPVIIVANHQSMYDISPLMWYFRKHHVKFVSKKELGTGIPSVSYNLRHGGSTLIDRKSPRQSIKAINDFGAYIEDTKRAAVIFPEGTRSKDGTPRAFQKIGLASLFKNVPSAIVVPVTINNSWKTLQYGKFPMGIGAHITLDVHKPINLATFADKRALIDQIEATVTGGIHLK